MLVSHECPTEAILNIQSMTISYPALYLGNFEFVKKMKYLVKI